MYGARLQFDQEILIEVLVFRHAHVVSGKGADRRLGFPEHDHQKCAVSPSMRRSA
jgi:hypothetical protein